MCYFHHGSLSGHQHTQVMELSETPQRTVGQHHLVRCHLWGEINRAVLLSDTRVMCKLPTVQVSHLDLQKVRQLLGLGFSQRVPSVCHEHHRNPVFPIAVHQVPETLFGCRDGGPSSYQHPVNVKQKPKQAALLFTHVLKTNVCIS